MKKSILISIILSVFLLINSYEAKAYKKVVEKNVTKEHGGLGGFLNRYSDVVSDWWVDEKGGKHVNLSCKYPGWQYCRVSNIIYTNPLTGNPFNEEISALIDTKCDYYIENSEKIFRATGNADGSDSELIAIKDDNDTILYYLSFTATWTYKFSGDESFDGGVNLVVAILTPDEVN